MLTSKGARKTDTKHLPVVLPQEREFVCGEGWSRRGAKEEFHGLLSICHQNLNLLQ